MKYQEELTVIMVLGVNEIWCDYVLLMQLRNCGIFCIHHEYRSTNSSLYIA